MQIKRVEALKPGMQLARTIYTSDGRILLSAGTILRESYIKRLIEFGYPAVYIGDPAVAARVKEPISEVTRHKAMKVLHEGFSAVKVGGTFDLAPIEDVVYSMIDEVIINSDVAVHLTDIRSHDDYTFGHSVNVCVLSIVMGIALELDQRNLAELAMGAMLHDVGKTQIPEKILLKSSKLNAVEWEEMKRHARFGFDLLRLKPELSAKAAHVAYQHHERVNGSGYPRGLVDDEIHLFARIASVADTYDAMTSDRVYRKGVPPHLALQAIAGLRGLQFDPELVDIFLKSVVPYPPGCKVELANGDVGMVVDNPRPGEIVVRLMPHEEADELEAEGPTVSLYLRADAVGPRML
ncbi:MAG: HD-GYP domain-containing protein [Firmicutes bacterium]|nr:HD-GYP domain-containing protein [Bacillota bacterium]